jgi:hypothetical protein
MTDDLIFAGIDQDKVAILMDEMVKEIFWDTFKRVFEMPDEAIVKKVKQADFMLVKEWIPNIASAKKVEDIFVSSLERTFIKYGVNLMNTKFKQNVCLDDINTLEDFLKIKIED